MTRPVTSPPLGRQADTAPPERDLEDWTGADFDSCEVLASLHVPDPIARITRARRGRRQAERAVERSAR
jgi:hypothetical protein